MAKAHAKGPGNGRGSRTPPPVRVRRKGRPDLVSATTENLLSAAGSVRLAGGIVVYSGVAQPSNASNPRSDPLENPLPPGWGWRRWTIDAPPPGGQVLWLTLEMPSQWWHYTSAYVEKNNSGHFKYFDIGVTWRWGIFPDRYIVPGSPACLQDNGTYEFYASQAPGSRICEAWWVHPSRGVTLLPSDKDSDPNSLALLLRSEQSGRLHLMFAHNVKANWTIGGAIADEPYIHASSLHFAMGIGLPKPVVTSSNEYDVAGGAIGQSKPQRGVRIRRQLPFRQ